MFQPTELIQMKHNLHKIYTYDISKSIIRQHKKTIFKIRKIHENENGQYALRIYPFAWIYNQQKNKYEKINVEFVRAYFNPNMFEKAEVEL